jgi:hypothetical protein
VKNVHRGGEKWFNQGFFARYGIFVPRESGQIIKKFGFFLQLTAKQLKLLQQREIENC